MGTESNTGHSKVFDSFLFRNEGNGCLSSVYMEHQSNRPFTESCISQGPVNADPFIGTFDTSWLEPQNRTGRLVIKRTGMTYDLTWSGFSDDGSVYRGTAFLSEGKLIGSYWLQS